MTHLSGLLFKTREPRKTRKPTTRQTHAKTRLLGFEDLEARKLLTDVTWTGGPSGSWQSSANWTSTPAYPTPHFVPYSESDVTLGPAFNSLAISNVTGVINGQADEYRISLPRSTAPLSLAARSAPRQTAASPLAATMASPSPQ